MTFLLTVYKKGVVFLHVKITL